MGVKEKTHKNAEQGTINTELEIGRKKAGGKSERKKRFSLKNGLAIKLQMLYAAKS